MMLKKELEIEVERLTALTNNMQQQNVSMAQYIQGIQTKVNDLAALVEHYEQTINVLSGRILEKNDLISKQNEKNKEATI